MVKRYQRASVFDILYISIIHKNEEIEEDMNHHIGVGWMN